MTDAQKVISSILIPLAVIAGVSWRGFAVSEVGRPAPEITGQVWLNSVPLQLADLKDKVVLVEFWTFGCYNCRNVEPHVKEWYDRYAEQGLVVIGVHTPESSYERSAPALEAYLHTQQIRYPVVTDNDFTTWDRYGNRAWPAVYIIDKHGLIRYTHIGEGRYDQTEQQIQALLAER